MVVLDVSERLHCVSAQAGRPLRRWADFSAPGPAGSSPAGRKPPCPPISGALYRIQAATGMGEAPAAGAGRAALAVGTADARASHRAPPAAIGPVPGGGVIAAPAQGVSQPLQEWVRPRCVCWASWEGGAEQTGFGATGQLTTRRRVHVLAGGWPSLRHQAAPCGSPGHVNSARRCRCSSSSPLHVLSVQRRSARRSQLHPAARLGCERRTPSHARCVIHGVGFGSRACTASISDSSSAPSGPAAAAASSCDSCAPDVAPATALATRGRLSTKLGGRDQVCRAV